MTCGPKFKLLETESESELAEQSEEYPNMPKLPPVDFTKETAAGVLWGLYSRLSSILAREYRRFACDILIGSGSVFDARSVGRLKRIAALRTARLKMPALAEEATRAKYDAVPHLVARVNKALELVEIEDFMLRAIERHTNRPASDARVTDTLHHKAEMVGWRAAGEAPLPRDAYELKQQKMAADRPLGSSRPVGSFASFMEDGIHSVTVFKEGRLHLVFSRAFPGIATGHVYERTVWEIFGLAASNVWARRVFEWYTGKTHPLPEPVPGPSEGLSLYDKTYAPPPKLSPNAALGHPSAPKGFVAYTDTDDAERASAPAHTRPIDSQKTFEVYGQYVTARVVGTGWLRLTTYGPSTHGAEVTEKSLEDIFHLSASRAEASLVFEWYTGAPRELPAGVHMARREGEWSIVNDGTVNHLFLEVEADGFVRAHGARFRLGGGGLDDLFCMAKKHVWAHLAVCWLGGLKA